MKYKVIWHDREDDRSGAEIVVEAASLVEAHHVATDRLSSIAEASVTKSESADTFLKRIDGLIYALTHFHSNPEGSFYIGQTLVECEAFLQDHAALGNNVQLLINEIVDELDSDERKEMGALDPVISVSKVRRLVKHLRVLRQEHLPAEGGTS